MSTVFVTVLFQRKAHEYHQQFNGNAEAIRQQAVDFIYQQLLELLERHQQAPA